jgi:hypothetical protein
MPATRVLWRHGLPPVVSVLLGSTVGLITNIVSGSDRTVTAVAGLIVTALVWAGWEGWRALQQAADSTAPAAQAAGATDTAPGVQVRQQIRHNRGNVVGVRGPAEHGNVHIAQEVDVVDENGGVTGLDLR